MSEFLEVFKQPQCSQTPSYQSSKLCWGLTKHEKPESKGQGLGSGFHSSLTGQIKKVGPADSLSTWKAMWTSRETLQSSPGLFAGKTSLSCLSSS